MAPLKATGIDGFPALFYQKYWHLVGKDVAPYCLSILNGGHGLSDINSTHIILIPKCLYADLWCKSWRSFGGGTTLRTKASLGSNPSYVWRSLWSSKGLIIKGMGWRIGSGQRINIWSDSWLPDPHGEQVCSIPLSKTDLDDEIVWRYDGSGLYNVKSGYKLLLKERQSDYGMYVAAPLSISRFFSSMWGVSLPAKVKINMWRVMNNFLSTYANLQARRLNVNNCCPLCGSEAENVQHIMWECVFVKELLGAQGIQVANQYPDVPWMEWMALVFERLSSVQRHALMVTYWVVWHARNKVVHEGVQPSVTNSLSFILASLKEYEMLNLKGDTRPLPIQSKDNTGLILAACSLSHKYVRNAFMAEALACKQAATFAWELGFSRVVLEGDSRTVIQKCKSEIVDASLISPVIADIKAICRNFMDFVFGHVQREANIEEALPRTLLAAEKDRAALGSVSSLYVVLLSFFP
ncbi:hypothetical protein GQ457_04G006420 [Hibiscus cannabinus]